VGIAYRLMYRLGFTPWDAVLPGELTAIMEGPGALPAGRALDLGSGLGRKAIYMAGHGWHVTGVESVPHAVREASRRARSAGVEVDFRLGDVTRLGDLGLTPGYSLVFDFGCYHGLKPDQRVRYADGVTALAAPGATLLMMAFTRPVPPITAGVTEPELRERFGGGWELLGSHPTGGSGTSAMSRGASAWFNLARR
jgi:cyclopropane fatty-acyl-phospholipid synthase-like methyltransferase